jgi:hypothetical protein
MSAAFWANREKWWIKLNGNERDRYQSTTIKRYNS